ncbi:MAG: LptA/OstA family protein [Bdellovibrionaceae bacterium]|nr:LptA/OstA family protein [Pseudobdellovibrionaceae bacterium]MDW8189575.1 LptA/OstA family protein [Pseudobdellovibrionaceae bacterium]
MKRAWWFGVFFLLIGVGYYISKNPELLFSLGHQADLFSRVKREIRAAREYLHLLRQIHWLESFDNDKEWELYAIEAKNKGIENIWELSQVEAYFYDVKKKSIKVVGNLATYHLNQRQLIISGHVRIWVYDDYVAETDQLIYWAAQRELQSQGEVFLKSQHDPSQSIQAGLIRALMAKEEIFFESGVLVKHPLNQEDALLVQSKLADLNRKYKTINLRDEVKVELPDSRFESNLATLFFNNFARRPYRIVMKDQVRLESKARKAECGRAVFHVDRGLVELTQNPVLWESHRRVEGERIILDYENDEVTVDKIRAKSQEP